MMLNKFSEAINKHIQSSDKKFANPEENNNIDISTIKVTMKDYIQEHTNDNNIGMYNNLSNNIEKTSAVVLIDGTNFFMRAAALAKYNHRSDSYNYLNQLLNLFNKHLIGYKFEDIFISIDGKNHNIIRNVLHENYKHKNGSESFSKTIKLNIQLITVLLEYLNIKYKITNGYEADDLISFLTYKTKYKNKNIIIVTGDKDYYQLLSDDKRIIIYDIIKKKYIDCNLLLTEYNIKYPSNFIFYKIVVGDGSDNIKGIAGIGEKTFINKIASTNIFVDNDIKNLNDFFDILPKYINNDNSKTVQKIIDNKSLLEKNYRLMNLYLFEQNITNKSLKLDLIKYCDSELDLNENVNEDINKLVSYFQSNMPTELNSVVEKIHDIISFLKNRQ